jgi:hypothetical protein
MENLFILQSELDIEHALKCFEKEGISVTRFPIDKDKPFKINTKAQSCNVIYHHFLSAKRKRSRNLNCGQQTIAVNLYFGLIVVVDNPRSSTKSLELLSRITNKIQGAKTKYGFASFESSKYFSIDEEYRTLVLIIFNIPWFFTGSEIQSCGC